MTATALEPTTTYFKNEHSSITPNMPNYWAALWVLLCTVHLTVCSCHVMYAFHSESTIYICLNVKKLLAQNGRYIWSLSDYNWTRTRNQLVQKQIVSHLAKLAKWLSCVMGTYLYGSFSCMLFSCDARIWEWMHSLYFPNSQGTPCSKQVQYLKFKWLRLDSNPLPRSS